MVAQLEKCGLIENLGKAVGHLIAHADEVRLGQAAELALAEVVLPVLVVLTAALSMKKQHSGAAVQLGAEGVAKMAEKVAEEGAPLGSNTTGCSFSLAGSGGNFEKARASID
eukprot:279301-Pleurochrysis_carterae.AAC.1